MPAPAIPIAPDIPRNDEAGGLRRALDTLETEEMPYRSSVISGTKEIPADIASAIEGLLDGAVERKGKQEIYTMYDKFGIPSRVDGLRIQMMLREKDPQTGKPLFYARPPAGLPRQIILDPTDLETVDALVASKEAILVGGRCEGCGKPIAENPHQVRPSAIRDREDAEWRVDQMKFPHMMKRHPMTLFRVYRDKERREMLTAAAIQQSK